jgi:hypothetical protein
VIIGGDANRNDAAFEERFAKMIDKLEK